MPRMNLKAALEYSEFSRYAGDFIATDAAALSLPRGDRTEFTAKELQDIADADAKKAVADAIAASPDHARRVQLMADLIAMGVVSQGFKLPVGV